MATPQRSRVKLSTYAGTYLALVALATLSLLLRGLPERAALGLALIIAGMKAVAVLLVFMHLIEERASARFVMLVSSLLVAVLIVLTALDPLTRAPFPPAPSRNPSYSDSSSLAPTPNERSRPEEPPHSRPRFER